MYVGFGEDEWGNFFFTFVYLFILLMYVCNPLIVVVLQRIPTKALHCSIFASATESGQRLCFHPRLIYLSVSVCVGV